MADKVVLRQLIDHLPERLKADYAKNQEGFGGNDPQMDAASWNMVDNLKHMLADVLKAGLAANALGSDPGSWIETFVQHQQKLYAAIAEPEGPGTGGTIVRQEVPGYLMGDLQTLTETVVQALMEGVAPDEDGSFAAWKTKWKAAQSS